MALGLAEAERIATAVSVRPLPESVPPVAGAHVGAPDATLDMGVRVSPV
jgi:hypothetical protein